MVGLLISLTLIALLVVALQPAHRRGWRPGFNSVIDRDRARLIEELNLLESFEPVEPTPQAATADQPGQDPAVAA